MHRSQIGRQIIRVFWDRYSEAEGDKLGGRAFCETLAFLIFYEIINFGHLLCSQDLL